MRVHVRNRSIKVYHIFTQLPANGIIIIMLNVVNPVDNINTIMDERKNKSLV